MSFIFIINKTTLVCTCIKKLVQSGSSIEKLHVHVTCNNINLTAALYKTYNINNISNTDTPCRKKVTKQSPVKLMAYDCPVFSL